MAKGTHETEAMKSIEAALLVIGEKATEIIQRQVQDVAYDTGRLHDSISFATDKKDAKVGGRAEEGDAIMKPSGSLELHIGTACPYAQWIEMGSAPISESSRTDGKFRERINEWAARHGFSELAAKYIANKIAARGLPPRQFMKSSEIEIYDMAEKTIALAVDKLMNRLLDKKPMVIEVPITMTTTHVRSKR